MSPYVLSAAASVAILIGSVGAAYAVTLRPAQPLSVIMPVHSGGASRRVCRAIGVTVNGRRIRGVAGRGFGRGACAKARNKCRFDLRQRQRNGRNPLGRCIVLR